MVMSLICMNKGTSEPTIAYIPSTVQCAIHMVNCSKYLAQRDAILNHIIAPFEFHFPMF